VIAAAGFGPQLQQAHGRVQQQHGATHLQPLFSRSDQQVQGTIPSGVQDDAADRLCADGAGEIQPGGSHHQPPGADGQACDKPKNTAPTAKASSTPGSTQAKRSGPRPAFPSTAAAGPRRRSCSAATSSSESSNRTAAKPTQCPASRPPARRCNAASSPAASAQPPSSNDENQLGTLASLLTSNSRMTAFQAATCFVPGLATSARQAP